MKAALRKKMLELRRAVVSGERAAYSRRICECLRTRFSGARATVAVYLATCDEVSLDGFIAAPPPGLRLAAPRWDAASRSYALAEIGGLDPAALPTGRFGIREPGPDAPPVAPEDVDAWLVPGLAFTASGRRLGYGGGYYDRFLAAAKPSALSIAVAYPFQLLDSLPAEEHDRPVGEVLCLR